MCSHRPLRGGPPEVRSMIEPLGGFILVHAATPIEIARVETARAFMRRHAPE